MHVYTVNKRELGSIWFTHSSLENENRGESLEIDAIGAVLKRKGMEVMEFSLTAFKSCSIKSQTTEPGEFMLHKILVSSYHES